MSIELHKHTGDGWRLGIEDEKAACMLEQMAAGIRAGVIVLTKIETASVFKRDEREAGRLNIEFNEKVID